MFYRKKSRFDRNLMVNYTNAFVSANTLKLDTCCGAHLVCFFYFIPEEMSSTALTALHSKVEYCRYSSVSGLNFFLPTSPVSEYTLDRSGSFGTWKSLWFPFLLKRRIFDVWAVPVKVPWLLSLSGLSRFLRSSSVSPDQFRGPTNLWAGNRNEQIHVLGKKKKTHKTHSTYPNICNLMHDCLLPLFWHRYRSVAQSSSCFWMHEQRLSFQGR